MDKLYIETSIVSYATARPSRDITIAGLQQQARDWWAKERHPFHLVTSQLTLDEASDGDPTAAAGRLKLLTGLSLIDINADVVLLANRLIEAHTMPKKAAADAIHVAAAALGGVKYYSGRQILETRRTGAAKSGEVQTKASSSPSRER